MQSGVIRLAGNGSGGVGQFLGTMQETPSLGATGPYEPIEQLIRVGIVVFSLVLLGLSISAYRKTAFKGILYAAVAFGLFAIQMLFEYLVDAVKLFSTPVDGIIVLGMTLVSLVFFFLAVVKRK